MRIQRNLGAYGPYIYRALLSVKLIECEVRKANIPHIISGTSGVRTERFMIECARLQSGKRNKFEDDEGFKTRGREARCCMEVLGISYILRQDASTVR